MNAEEFKYLVGEELKKLDRKQVVCFAWVCAVRALPFLGAKGNFGFWRKDDRQKHLYSLFYALDFCLVSEYDQRRLGPSNILTAAYASGAKSVYAADAVYYASETANNYYLGKAVDAAAALATVCSVNSSVDIESIIINDLKVVQSGDDFKFQPFSYGVIWDNFMKALEKEGCEYWGRLYSNVLNNGYEWAKKSARARMSVPKEISVQGARSVAIYFDELEKGSELLNEARIIILGEKGAGKTCLARKLINPTAPMTTDKESTAGVDTTIWKLDDNKINVHIWDFAGHTVTHAVHQFFLSERCLYIIVYDGRTEERNRLDYWLDHMKNYGGNSTAIVLVNKRDKHQVDIPINRLKEQYPIEGLYSFSIQDDLKQLEIFRGVVSDFIRNNPSWDKKIIPYSYYKVKNELESRFIKGDKEKCEEHITKDEFCRIAKKNGIEDSEVLLVNLNSLGISLWYSKMDDFNTLVLNPEWISHGVYKIINWASEEKKHQLTIDEFYKVFENDSIRYPSSRYDFFFRLMEHYELAYKTNRGKCLIIPHLLDEDRPVLLPDFPIGESLMLRYRAEQPLPPNTISRFIVRHNQEIKKEGCKYIVWRYGVVLEDGRGGLALVREEDRTINVFVKGASRKDYIISLRDTLNDIFNSYQSNKPALQYRVERYGEIQEEVERKNPVWLTDMKILNHLRNDTPYYEDVTGQLINLNYTVNNYNISAQTILGDVLTDQSIQNIFNFNNCSISLQGNLNDLARIVQKSGNNQGAVELRDAAEVLELAEQCKTPEEIKKKGIVNSLKKILQDLGDEKSSLYKTIKGIEKGVSIAQDIAKGYNEIAQWLGIPQIPKPFLNKEVAGRKKFRLFG